MSSPARVPVGEFKAKCLKLISEVEDKRRSLVITKRGRPVARLSPIPEEGDFVGSMRGTGEILGDIISPIDVEWDAMK